MAVSNLCTRSKRNKRFGRVRDAGTDLSAKMRAAALAGLILCLTTTAMSAQAKPNVVVSQTTLLAGYPSGGAFGNGTAAGTSFAVNSKGNLITGTSYGGQIVQFNGTTGAKTLLGSYSNPGPVAIDASDNVYIADLYDTKIVKVPNGVYGTVSTPASGTPTCTGNDTAECVLPGMVSGPYGYAAMIFDAAGNLFFTSTNGGSSGNAIYECNVACLKSATPAAVMIYQEPTSATAQLIIGGIAADTFGNFFFTDSVVDSNEQSSVSHVNELVKAGSGFSTTATVLYTLTIPSPSQYDNQITSVAVDAAGTVYFADEFDGIFGFPSSSGTVDTSTLYTFSNTGAKIMTTDGAGNFYIAAYSSVTGGDAAQKIGVGTLTLPPAGVGTPSTASVTTILNDITSCTPAPTVTFTSGSTDFSAAATGTCSLNGLSSIPTIPTTVTLTPTSVGGTRSTVLTATEGNGSTGTATATGFVSGPPDVLLSQTTMLAAYPSGGAFGGGTGAGTSFAVNSLGNLITGTSYGGQIVQYNGTTGVATVLGSYSNPGPVAIDSNNNFYIADIYDTTIVKVPFGAYATVAAATASTPVCTGNDTAECTLPSMVSGPYGYGSMIFDASGNLFFTSTNGGASANAIYECSAACLTSSTPAATMIFQEPVSATAQLVIGGMATDTYGDLFFTDSVVDANLKSTVSNVNELLHSGSGTGFSSTPTVLYTLTDASPSNNDNEITSVAVGADGTLYFADEFDGVFGMTNTAGVIDTASLFTASLTGAKIMTTDGQGDFYIAAYSNATGSDAAQRISLGKITTPASGIGTTVSASNVTTILNDVVGCAGTPAITFTATENGTATTEISATTTGGCSTGGFNSASTYATTVSFTPAALGTRSALLTATETNGNSGSAVVTGLSSGPPTDTPTITPGTGTYTTIQSVTLADTSTGAVIYYTTDGSTPTTNSTVYSGPITVSTSETIEAMALAPSDGNSAVASATFTINLPPAATPAIAPAAGTYTAAQSVTIADSTPGATIYYTTDGTTPTTASTQYGGAFAVGVTETVQAIAVATGYTNSPVASASYVINLPTATPTFTPTPTTYNAVQQVTIADSTAGATIYYTTDGTTPTTSSTVYTAPISVGVTETLQAIATAPNYSTSAVASASYVINLPTFTLSINPGTLTIASAGGQGRVNVILTPLNTFAATTTFVCSGLPAGATCAFAPASVLPYGNNTVTTVMTINSNLTQAELHGGPNRLLPTATLALALCFFGLRKRRGMKVALTLAIGLFGSSLISGCGGATVASHTPTTSTITVTATSGTLMQTATMTLIVQ